MERYKSNEKIKNKTSTFSALKNFFQTAKKVGKRFDEVTNRMEELKNQENGEQSQEYINLSLEAEKLDKTLEKIEKAKANVKKEFLKLGTLVLGFTLAITGTIAGILYGIQTSRENRVMEALEMQGTQVASVYKESPDKLKELAKSPEEVTQLALDTLKQNLANHYEVSNKNDFEISYKTEISDKQPSDTKQIYIISYKGETICSYVTRTDSSGNRQIDENTMPKEVKNSIDTIVDAQENPESSFKAHLALRKANSKATVQSIDSELPDYLPNNGIER